jgi:hypothetical protein
MNIVKQYTNEVTTHDKEFALQSVYLRITYFRRILYSQVKRTPLTIRDRKYISRFFFTF